MYPLFLTENNWSPPLWSLHWLKPHGIDPFYGVAPWQTWDHCALSHHSNNGDWITSRLLVTCSARTITRASLTWQSLYIKWTYMGLSNTSVMWLSIADNSRMECDKIHFCWYALLKPACTTVIWNSRAHTALHAYVAYIQYFALRVLYALKDRGHASLPLSACFMNLVIWCFDLPRKCTTSTGVTVIGSAVSIFPVNTAWSYILKL